MDQNLLPEKKFLFPIPGLRLTPARPVSWKLSLYNGRGQSHPEWPKELAILLYLLMPFACHQDVCVCQKPSRPENPKRQRPYLTPLYKTRDLPWPPHRGLCIFRGGQL